MTSRTPEGKHTKRFIVLRKVGEKNYERSISMGEAFETREAAEAAIATRSVPGVEYKIRQK